MTLGVKVTHVPYRGAGPVMQDLIGGRIDYMCDTIQTGAAQANQDTVKGIAVMSPKRVPIIANLATTGEQGLPGVEATVWNAFFLPKGTPAAIVQKYNKAMRDMLNDPAMQKRLQEPRPRDHPGGAAQPRISRELSAARRSSAGARW